MKDFTPKVCICPGGRVSTALSWIWPLSSFRESHLCPVLTGRAAQTQRSRPAWSTFSHMETGRQGQPGATLLRQPRRVKPERLETAEAAATVCLEGESRTGVHGAP